MSLRSIGKSKGPTMRIAYWMTRRQPGTVIIPMKVMFPRMPKVVKLSYEIQKFEMKGIRLDHELHFMEGILVAEITRTATSKPERSVNDAASSPPRLAR